MTSSTSNSNFRLRHMPAWLRAMLPILLAYAIIVSIEFGILLSVGQKQVEEEINRISILELNYLKKDVGQKYNIGYKNALFLHSGADFIQIGDSSGAYGIRPRIIESFLGDKRYITTNCCADVGWQGYIHTAEHYLKHNLNEKKYLVLAITPYSLPGQYNEGFSEDFDQAYTSPWSIFYSIPSLYYRQSILHQLYYHKPFSRLVEYDSVMDHLGIEKEEVAASGKDLFDFTKESGGWQPYGVKPHKTDMPLSACGPKMMEYDIKKNGKSVMVSMLEEMAKITKKYNAKMILLFNPVACHDNDALLPIKLDIQKFQQANPDVWVPMPLINTLPEAHFSDQWHLNQEAAIEYSLKLGEAFKWMLDNEQK